MQLLIQAFKKVLTDQDSTWFKIFFEKINNLVFHQTMYKNSIFIYMTLAVSLIYLIYAIISPSDFKSIKRQNEKKIISYNKFKDKMKDNQQPLMTK